MLKWSLSQLYKLTRNPYDFEDTISFKKDIENICFNLLVQQQPVAKDLRTITAAMKMVTDMERIGDHAADINKKSGD